MKTYIVLLFLIAIVICISLGMGAYSNNFKEIIISFQDKNQNNEVLRHVVINIRLPRIIMVSLVGGGLSVAGATLQGVFQNPLVSPDLLGVSSGAGLGAIIGIVFFGNMLIVNSLSLIMGLSSIIIVYVVSNNNLDDRLTGLILSGVTISAFYNSLIALMKFLADTDKQLPAITYWLMGSFSESSYEQVKMAIFPILLSCFGIFINQKKIHILSLGDEEAFSLGINPNKTRLFFILCSTVITTFSVIVSGIVGWIGLIVPHLAKRIIGIQYDKLLFTSFLLGILLLNVIDLLSRAITASELPIGIFTAIVGAPLFIILNKRGNME
ncbi:iron (Fe3+) ABC superfamily ATP binding cassette transporter, membrane protein (plasmid) [Enterococcus mundtii QU 25]|uniref:FecCD family ABC transporter permease n=1 Tax=Enterococcus mundtii TaxID=53346 RepID=UPI0003C55D8A|nr:iron ABC transporter permease [Enterococcus mundtii]MBE6172589.1 iron ABC transporter permease [Enterococcus faecium]BAO08609.1 iron (Fe3+) ABC superfamily ATP binding cassette transporter, membrane protein [Enterococcus mundtii QU 25]